MKRPPQHWTGELGELQVAQRLVEHGWIVTKLHSDYGFDFLAQRVEGESVTADFALIQVKALQEVQGAGGVRHSNQRSCRILSKHLELWKSCPIPCFLALVQLPTGPICFRNGNQILHDLRFSYRADEKNRSYSILFRTADCEPAQMAKMREAVAGYWTKFRSMIASEADVVYLDPLHAIEHDLNDSLAQRLRPFVGDEIAAKIGQNIFASLLRYLA